jgi:chemotaxis protein histidine kinase CheA
MSRALKAVFDPPWWFMLFGWPAMLAAALYYAWPAGMDDFIDAAPAPEMKLAIMREVKGSERRVVLEFAAATLRHIARYVQDESGRDSIDEALDEIDKRIRQGYRPPSSRADDEKPKAEKPARAKRRPPNSVEQQVEQQVEKRIKQQIDKQSQERAGRAEQFGIEVHGDDDMRINLGMVDEHLLKALEAKYGTGPLPALDPVFAERIYAGVKQQVHRLVTGILVMVLLVLAFPFFIFTKIVASVIRAFSSRAEVSEKAAEQSALARQLTEAKLAALQAQIEPHFLFNTLASVRQLILTDPEAAAKMQADLIKYLRAAIPQMRESSTTTLAREAELSRAYLDILKVRMEARLSWSIDIPPALGAAGFPPMMLPTLVENAIKHGLEPLTQGGEIRISAAAAGGKLRVSVADTGVGFADEPGTGVGLANVRERLASLYGKQGQLIVESNSPRGAKVTIEIPYSGGKAL